MTNIHQLSDYRESSANSSAFPPLPSNSAAYGYHQEQPRCIDMFFPGFTWKSVLLWISFVQIAVFIATLVVSGNGLRPSGHVLYMFGSSYGPAIQQGEVWRLITPLFLHGSVIHILMNVFFQLRMGFTIEAEYGLPMSTLVYFGSGIAGNMFSVALSPCVPAVGASTAGFGLIGVQMAEMMLMWHMLRNRDRAIFNIVLFAVMCTMISLSPNSNVDWRGHLGGFICGFACSVLLNKNMENRPRWYLVGFYSAIATLIAQPVCCLVVVFAIPMSYRCSG